MTGKSREGRWEKQGNCTKVKRRSQHGWGMTREGHEKNREGPGRSREK